MVAAGVLASLLIISWSIFIATCVVVLCRRTISSETSSNVKRKALYSLYICTFIYESVSIICVYVFQFNIHHSYIIVHRCVVPSSGNESTINKNEDMEKNPAYVPIEMNQIENKPIYINL